MTNFLQVKDNAYSRVPNNALNNTSNSITITGIDTRRFMAVTTGYYLTIWDDATYPDPTDDPNMELALVIDAVIGLSGSLSLVRTTAYAHAGTPMIALLVISRHLTDLNTAVNTAETSLATKVDAAAAAAAAPVQSVAGRTGAVTLSKTDVNLGNVDNTSDVNKPVSTATQAAINTKASKSGDDFTGDIRLISDASGGEDTTDSTRRLETNSYQRRDRPYEH
jgi:hypothetical protein